MLKIKYPATCPPLPNNLTGNTFEAVFGTNQSMLELFILKRKIKGPCWLTLKNVKKVTDYHRTWCRQEVVIDDPKDAACTIDDMNKPSPPLVSLCLNAKITRSQQNTSEIAMISFLVQTKVNQDGPTKDTNYTNFTFVRKLDQMPLPYDLN